MLVSFSVQNFRSIYEKQELTLLASKYSSFTDGLLKDRRVARGVLPVIVIYGPNASGKTNLLRALHFMASAIRKSHNRWTPESKINSDPNLFHKNEPTSFECVFILNKQVFRFGFSHDQERILTEHLYSGKSLIYRRSGNRYRFGAQLAGFENIKKNTRSNALFLSAAAQNNHPLLKRIHAWFSSWDTITEDRTVEEAITGHMMENEEGKSFLSQIATLLCPDVIGLEPGDAQLPDMPSLEDEQMARMLKDYAKFTQIKSIHKSVDGRHTEGLDLVQESKGTRSYLALASAIFSVLRQGTVLILDEADQGLHPSLLRSIVLLFQRPATNPKGAQLIFNTHETSLLSPEVMRPDEVWFVAKEKNACSRLYSLADFEGIRSDTKAQRSYLEGRFGAVPFLEDHANLFIRALAEKPKRATNA